MGKSLGCGSTWWWWRVTKAHSSEGESGGGRVSNRGLQLGCVDVCNMCVVGWCAHRIGVQRTKNESRGTRVGASKIMCAVRTGRREPTRMGRVEALSRDERRRQHCCGRRPAQM